MMDINKKWIDPWRLVWEKEMQNHKFASIKSSGLPQNKIQKCGDHNPGEQVWQTSQFRD